MPLNQEQIPSGVFNNGDPIATFTPNAPSAMAVQLLSDNVTYQVSIATAAYSLYNLRNIAVSQKIRVYFTPVTSVTPSSLLTPTQIANAFSKAIILEEFSAPQSGGISYRKYDAQTLGDGLFWATIINPAAYGRLESAPAGPAFIDTGAEARLISSVVPPDVVHVAGYGTPTVVIATPTGQSLKYATITMGYAPATPKGSFDGVEVWIQGYFSNYGAVTPTIIEGPFFKYTGMPTNVHPRAAFVTITLLCDYDSTALPPLSTAHDVKIYLVAASDGRTIPLPITSRPLFDFPNGIGA